MSAPPFPALYHGQTREARDAAIEAMMAVFGARGCEALDPPALIDADAMLRLYGERARGSAFVFTDRERGALCLRPDFTLPIGAWHVASGRSAARYAYAGPVFGGAEGEAHQTGFELFGEDNRIESDIEAVEMVLAALSAAGVTDPVIELGDIALIDALIEALRDVTGAPLPRARRARLRRHYWRPDRFAALLAQDGNDRPGFADQLDLVDRFALERALEAGADAEQARAVLSAVIARAGGPEQGERPLSDIADRLREETADHDAPPISPASLTLIKGALAVEGPAALASARIAALANAAGADLGEPLEALSMRASALSDRLGQDRVHFSGAFHARMEYYTGFMFRARRGDRILASGGRYGALLQALGAPGRAPAVGAAIFVSALAPPERIEAQPAAAPATDRPLVLAIPSKGRLKEQFAETLTRAGLTLEDTGLAREYAARIKGLEGVEARLMSAGEMPGELAAGSIDACITGRDMIHERVHGWQETVEEVVALDFAHADLVCAVPRAWVDVWSLDDLDDVAARMFAARRAPLKVATKYLHLTRTHFEAAGVAHYVIVESLGATEAAPATGAADAIVDITTTGQTLKDNHLKIITEPPMLRSEACLFATRRSIGPSATAALALLRQRLSP